MKGKGGRRVTPGKRVSGLLILTTIYISLNLCSKCKQRIHITPSQALYTCVHIGLGTNYIATSSLFLSLSPHRPGTFGAFPQPEIPPPPFCEMIYGIIVGYITLKTRMKKKTQKKCFVQLFLFNCNLPLLLVVVCCYHFSYK